MFKKIGLLVVALFLSMAAAFPAGAQRAFDFSFVAPLGNGDVASGSGTLFTADADVDGRYHFESATGNYTAYDGEADVRTISGAIGLAGFFDLYDGYLYQDVSGRFVTDGVMFYDMPFWGIGFQRRGDGLYDGPFGEVAVVGGTLTFSPSVAGVPEPAAWGMLILGFGAVGVSLRRRAGLRARLA